MSRSVRVLMMGTPDFAVPILEALAETGYTVVGVFTQPDQRVGRNKTLSAPPLKEAAVKWGLPVFQPGSLRGDDVLAEVAALNPDLAITAAYGQLLPQRFLDIPNYGCLNVHASLLPRWRGAAPIQRAIMAGDELTGITIMKTVLALDAGPVLGVQEVPIDDADNFLSLHDKLSEAGAKLLLDLIPGYLSGACLPVPQREDGITYAERIVRQDEFLELDSDVKSVYNHARALSPRPGASVRFQEQALKLWAQGWEREDSTKESVLGAVTTRPGGKVGVRCRDGWLLVSHVQAAGKRKMAATDWLNGQKGKTVMVQPGSMAP